LARSPSFLYTFREREEILRLFEAVAGQRMMTSYIRIGGLAMEPPLDFLDRVQAFIQTPSRRRSTSMPTC
jgi:NADH-quinone oxidoreductase subunit D